MFTSTMVFLMIANTMTAAGAFLAASQLSLLELGRKEQPSEVKRPGDAASERSLVDDRALAKAA